MQLAEVEGHAPNVYTAELDAAGLNGGGSGKIMIEVHRDWAPKGADRFFQLIKSGFYKDAGVFRVVPGFVVQFGINADPKIQQSYRGGQANIEDDPVTQSNKKGTVVFATSGPNSRTTQVFINLNDNDNLDSMGFTPFGKIVSGMDTVSNIYSGYGEQPDQSLIQQQGNQYLKSKFPQMTTFSGAQIVPSSGGAGPANAQGPPVPMAQPPQ